MWKVQDSRALGVWMQGEQITLEIILESFVVGLLGSIKFDAIRMDAMQWCTGSAKYSGLVKQSWMMWLAVLPFARTTIFNAWIILESRRVVGRRYSYALEA